MFADGWNTDLQNLEKIIIFCIIWVEILPKTVTLHIIIMVIRYKMTVADAA